MKHLFFIVIAFFATLGIFSGSCISDSISTSPSDILTFSCDTVNFDTVFTGVGTPTARLVVANRAKKGIMISSIRLKSDQSNFQINVDGVSGKEFHNVEIWKEDSIFIFIECLIPDADTSEISRVEDILEFVTNGVEQDVLLEAYGQNVTRLRNHRVSSEMLLTADRPYVVFDSLVVEPQGVLRIDPGVNLLFHENAQLIVHGRVEAIGAPDKMIQIRGDRLDNVLPDIGYDILAGQWQGIRITAESYGNRLEYIDMRSTREGLMLDSCAYREQTKLTLRNNWLHNSQGTVLQASNSTVEAYGVCFSEAADAVVDISGGNAKFVQCTFANNYLFAAISRPLLCLYNVTQEDAEKNDVPAMNGSFENCIIYGIAKDMNIEDFKDTKVYFRNVSMKSKGENGDNFIDCLWETDPLFLTVRPDYYFNYHVAPDSSVIGMGNPNFLNSMSLTDMDGINRLDATPDHRPTLGAYATAISTEK